MTISLDGEDATEMASCGILPDIGGGAIMRIGGMFGVVPQKSYRVDLALYIDPDNSDVHRIRAKVYQKDPMLENVQIQIGAGGDGDAPEPEEDESTDDAADTVKKGLPVRKPGRTESMMYFRVDFEELGNASAPALDDSAKLWLQLH